MTFEAFLNGFFPFKTFFILLPLFLHSFVLSISFLSSFLLFSQREKERNKEKRNQLRKIINWNEEARRRLWWSQVDHEVMTGWFFSLSFFLFFFISFFLRLSYKGMNNQLVKQLIQIIGFSLRSSLFDSKIKILHSWVRNQRGTLSLPLSFPFEEEIKRKRERELVTVFN